MDQNTRELLASYEAGDPAAAREIHDRYARRLIGLARRMLSDKLAARVDPEDVVQSAYRSFFVKARDGRFQWQHSGDLWRLLVAITRHKVLHQAERHTAAKRAVNQETLPSDLGEEGVGPGDVVAVSDELQSVLNELSPDDRLLLELRLRDEATDEIATALGKSPRTVRRMLLDLRRKLERRLGAATSATAHERSPLPTFDRVASLDYRDFRLEQMVGEGGFGKVYRAYWSAREMEVAVKSLRKQFLLDHRAIEHFLHEASIIAGLSHPGIIRAHGLGRTPAGGYFLVLDWHGWGDLTRYRPSSTSQAVNYVAQAANAIAHAHERGVVHCDLKPSNLLLADDGQVVVTDFGFAHAAGSETSSTPGGTLGFAAPELWHGSPSPACDVFSLGRVLRFLVERAETQDSSPARRKKLESVLESCENPDPTERGTAAELVESLSALC
jgi:RNA polymerase sigma factor (sigma-70 family)